MENKTKKYRLLNGRDYTFVKQGKVYDEKHTVIGSLTVKCCVNAFPKDWEEVIEHDPSELAQLKATNQALLEALRQIANTSDDAPNVMRVIAKQAIKKATAQ